MEILQFKLGNQQFQYMKEQKSQHNKKQEENANLFLKSLRLIQKMSPFNLFLKNSGELKMSKEEEQKWRQNLQNRFLVIDKDQQESDEEEGEDEQDNDKKGYEDQDQEGVDFYFDEDEEDIQIIKFKMKRLLKAYQKLEKQKNKLKEENTIMRRQLEEWLKSPIKIRRYARIQGQLRFDEECDQVKVQKSSFLELQEDEDN